MAKAQAVSGRISLYRKMSVAEAEKTLALNSVQPSIKGSHPLKHFSTSLEKVRAFRNKAVVAPERIIEVQFDSATFEELMTGAVAQKGGSRFPHTVQISTEGLTLEEISAGHVNLAIPPEVLDAFNQAVIATREVQ